MSGQQAGFGYLNQRIEQIAATQAKLIEDNAELKGQFKCMDDKIDTIGLTLEKIIGKSDTNGFMQKALIGAIIVQSLLAGVTTPDLAKSLIHNLFGGQ